MKRTKKNEVGIAGLAAWLGGHPNVIVSETLPGPESDVCIGVSRGHLTICIAPTMPAYYRDKTIVHELAHLLAEQRTEALSLPNFGMVRFNQPPPKREPEEFREDIAVEVRAIAYSSGLLRALGTNGVVFDARHPAWKIIEMTTRMVLHLDKHYIHKVIQEEKGAAIALAQASDLEDQLEKRLALLKRLP